jgi:hypothetical protein
MGEVLSSHSYGVTILSNYRNKSRPRRTDSELQVLPPDVPHAECRCTSPPRFWFIEHCAALSILTERLSLSNRPVSFSPKLWLPHQPSGFSKVFGESTPELYGRPVTFLNSKKLPWPTFVITEDNFRWFLMKKNLLQAYRMSKKYSIFVISKCCMYVSNCDM